MRSLIGRQPPKHILLIAGDERVCFWLKAMVFRIIGPNPKVDVSHGLLALGKLWRMVVMGGET